MPTIDELYKESETLKRAGKLEESIAILNQILAQDETHVLSHLALAVLLGKVGRHNDAVKHGERAVELEPKVAPWTRPGGICGPACGKPS